LQLIYIIQLLLQLQLTEGTLGKPMAIRPGLERGYRRPSPAPTALLVHSRFRPGLPPFIPGLCGLLTVRLRPRNGASILFVTGLGRPLAARFRLRAGLPPSVPDLGRLPAGLPRFRPRLYPSLQGVDLAACRPTPAPGASPCIAGQNMALSVWPIFRQK